MSNWRAHLPRHCPHSDRDGLICAVCTEETIQRLLHDKAVTRQRVLAEVREMVRELVRERIGTLSAAHGTPESCGEHEALTYHYDMEAAAAFHELKLLAAKLDDKLDALTADPTPQSEDAR